MKKSELGDNDYDCKLEHIDYCPDCGKSHTLLSQEDNHAEYITTVNIVCECGEVIPFDVPVN